ncbi:probable RNA methyltransferase At5g51130 isoform X1 [Amborella trichopoda]|nr:probable RNA methyltransferase At5g51130 isoform X1 [Amborella trichopoda]|eukprot:XP_006833420.2 probable RNA methyltransferase At5g51130 isoform X1 [Amborella trichopoda]
MALEAPSKDENKKRRRLKENSVYGNYKSYYGYRVDHSLSEEPRMKVMKKEWFEDKDCLDIGCNQGFMTISIAMKFFCRSMVGIDIDQNLVERAKRNLQRIAATKSAITSLEPCEAESSKGTESLELSKDQPTLKGTDLIESVKFRKENVLEKLQPCSPEYDTILCLSVTKWIHLNWGDSGLIALFAKMWHLLRPGGILVLEPQPWVSYQRKRRVSERAAANFKDILMKPCYFPEILLDKIGFRHMENATNNLQGSVVGFNRPIFVFRK